MSVKIRLRRVGATKRPSYRLVVADTRSPRNGRFIETVGHYNPLVEPAELVVKTERVEHWLVQGARPTVAAAKLLKRIGVTVPGTEPSQAPAETPTSAEAPASAE